MRGMLGVDGEGEGTERYESSTTVRSRFVTFLLGCQMSYRK
jgi:hypothetical protein